jgi:hypothetical protein
MKGIGRRAAWQWVSVCAEVAGAVENVWNVGIVAEMGGFAVWGMWKSLAGDFAGMGNAEKRKADVPRGTSAQ